MNKLGLILTILSTVCCGVFGDQNVILKKFNVIPQFVSEAGADLMRVIYDSGKMVNYGNELTPTQAQNMPMMIDWSADSSSYYTVIGIAPDATSTEKLLLMIVNILGKNITSGKTLAEYLPPAPSKSTDLNRVIFLVYKQPSELKFDVEDRSIFSAQKFTAKYGLGDPVAANFFLSK